MKKLINFILTFMISSTFTFTYANQVDEIQDLSEQLESFENINLMASEHNFEANKRKLIKSIDKAIKKAVLQHETLDQSLIRVKEEVRILFVQKTEKTLKLLKNERKLDRLYEKAHEKNEQLTFEKFVQILEASIAPEVEVSVTEKLVNKIKEAGSYVQFLENYKKEVIEIKHQEDNDRKESVIGLMYDIGDWTLTILIGALVVGGVAAAIMFYGWVVVVLTIVGVAVVALVVFLLLIVNAGWRVCSAENIDQKDNFFSISENQFQLV